MKEHEVEFTVISNGSTGFQILDGEGKTVFWGTVGSLTYEVAEFLNSRS